MPISSGDGRSVDGLGRGRSPGYGYADEFHARVDAEFLKDMSKVGVGRVW
jgi:hypothetical protein